MADLIIRGMEMPETCHGCPFNVSIYTYDGGDNTCALNAWNGCFEEPKITRHPDCPLLPLPAGHGRLIDADTLSESLAESATFNYNKRTYTTWADAFESMVDMLEEADAIVPAEGGGEE